MVTWTDCEARRAECRDEVDARVAKVEKCARGKVEKSTARWWIALLVPILVAAIGAGVAVAFTNSERSAKNEQAIKANERDIARIHIQLDRIEEYARAAAEK